MKHTANIPKTPTHYRFLAALASPPGADWREVAREYGLSLERAEALLRSSASKAFHEWLRALPHELRQACVDGYRLRSLNL